MLLAVMMLFHLPRFFIDFVDFVIFASGPGL